MCAAFAQSQEIVITHWGAALYGVPYAIAIEKKFFKESGVDITGVLRSTGGVTSVRNVLAAGTGYGEVALPAAISGIGEGLDFKIIHAGVVGYDMVYVAKPGSPMKSAEDIKGRKIGFTRPKSVTESFLFMLAEKLKIKRDEFQMVSIGSVVCDVIAGPTIPMPACFIQDTEVAFGRSRESVRNALLRLTRPANLAGLPSISVPCGFSSEGLPVGLQLIGRRCGESTVLRAAWFYEHSTPWHTEFPRDTASAF